MGSCCTTKSSSEIEENLMREGLAKRTEENTKYSECKQDLPQQELDYKDEPDSKNPDVNSIVKVKDSTNFIENEEKLEIKTLRKLRFEEKHNNFYQITLHPSKTLFDTKIYVIKGEVIYFSVSGLWKMQPYLDFVDEEGHENCTILENFGALCGKIGNEIFKIENDGSYNCIETGILYLFPFTLDTLIQPSGHLLIKVSGGNYISSSSNFDNIILREFEGKNCQYVKIGENSLSHEIDVQFGSKMTFSVRGKWRLFNNENFISKGYDDLSIECEDFPFGCIIFEYEGKKNTITDNFVFNSNTDGKGKIFANVGNWIVQPEGDLLILIETVINSSS
jgi:hypothetical protein